MTKENKGFGITGKRSFYQENRGKYFIFYLTGSGSNFSGKIMGVEDGKVVLNPHSGTEYVEGKRVCKLISRVSRIDLASIAAEEETSEESIAAFCEYQTRLAAKQDNPSKQ